MTLQRDSLGHFIKGHAGYRNSANFVKADSRLIGNKFAEGNAPNSTSFKKGVSGSPDTQFKSGEHPSIDTEFKKGSFGGKSPTWKGGVYQRKDGYIRVTIKGKSFLQHRYMLKDKLNGDSVVHHIDKNPSNNSIDNLMVFRNNAEHMKHHAKERTHKEYV